MTLLILNQDLLENTEKQFFKKKRDQKYDLISLSISI